MLRRPLDRVKHRIPHIPNIFLENFVAKIFTWDTHKSGTIERVIMNLQPLPFTPQVIENTLDLVEWGSFAVEITYDEIFVKFGSCLEN